MKKYVAGFVFNEEKTQIALIKKNRPTWQAGNYNAIGGHIEENETPLKAMAREFFEEADIQISDDGWTNFLTLFNSKYKVYFFRAFHSLEGIKSKTDEMVTVFDLKNLPNNKIKNLGWLIPLSLDMDLETPINVIDAGSN